MLVIQEAKKKNRRPTRSWGPEQLSGRLLDSVTFGESGWHQMRRGEAYNTAFYGVIHMQCSVV